MTNLTYHAEERIQQRQIDPRLVDLCRKYGKRVPSNHGRWLLKQEFIPEYELEGASRALIAHVEKQLPICCAFTEEDYCITAFRVKDRINKHN